MDIQLSGHALPQTGGERCDDAWAVREREGTIAAALADGVGASRHGGAAARRAVETLVDYGLQRPRSWSPRRALGEFAAQINRQLYSESIEQHGAPEFTSTLSAVLIEGGRLYGCNMGDSPVFHWRRGLLQRLSEAHTLADPGMTHVLTRAVGLEANVEPYFFETDLAAGDLVLLCSDGVSTALSEERLAELLSRRATARTIVSVAHGIGAEKPEVADDTSAIVLEVVDLGGSTAAARQRLEVVTALRPGDSVDKHRLMRPLDANARVWLAEDERGARVVLKFPPLEAAETEMLRDNFAREAWNATRLASPDLVRAWMPDGSTVRYYAMEYIDAPTLREVLCRGRLSVEETRELATFLLRVGEFLARHDLAHGDIKPENILVQSSAAAPVFRLLDLGSASGLFSVTTRAGTATYLAPERFRGSALSERTEIFAIGVTLHEALTGALPYGEIERFQTPRFEPPRPLTRLNPAIPPWLEAVVLRAVEADPERRYQHFSEMAYDLTHPTLVASHHHKDAPLLERNPLLFFKLLSLALFIVNLVLLGLLAGSGR